MDTPCNLDEGIEATEEAIELSLIDLGDAAKETKQTYPVGFNLDSHYIYGYRPG